jgi:hypothetical protein
VGCTGDIAVPAGYVRKRELFVQQENRLRQREQVHVVQQLHMEREWQQVQLNSKCRGRWRANGAMIATSGAKAMAASAIGNARGKELQVDRKKKGKYRWKGNGNNEMRVNKGAIQFHYD